MEQIINIAEFILDSFIHLWPYLIITIPLAVYVKLSGASKYISRAMGKKPVVSVFLATVVGAFSPFCSCGVIPVIASLLVGGVPLAPVMSFWIASPSMDPEIFFLSTASVGWKLSVWRLVATFILSLLSGLITHVCMEKGWLGKKILKENLSASSAGSFKRFTRVFANFKSSYFTRKQASLNAGLKFIPGNSSVNLMTAACCLPFREQDFRPVVEPYVQEKSTCGSTCQAPAVSFRKNMTDETWKATWMVTKFMTLAFFINALIQTYVPQHSVFGLLGGDGFSSVVVASLIGIPFYTSNITALPLVSGLLELGMSEGAALAFLISGPITTLPAMAAVRGLVSGRVFTLYMAYALIGSILFGGLVNLLALT